MSRINKLNQSGLHTNTSLRFRRWSRKGYALFISVTHVVSIGVLAGNVSQKAEVKSLVCTDFLADNNKADDLQGSEIEQSELKAQTTELVVFATAAPAEVAACYDFILYTLYSRKVVVVYPQQPFLFFY